MFFGHKGQSITSFLCLPTAISVHVAAVNKEQLLFLIVTPRDNHHHAHLSF